jgi:Contractile injection system tube protein
MPTYPTGPRLLKGAIVAISDVSPQPRTISLQYNPESVKRSLQAQTAGGDEGQRSQIVRFIGAPVETFDLEVSIDAIDQLEKGDNNAVNNGIYPQLALLETLVYPFSTQVKQNDALLASGSLEIAPLAAPLTLFVWGPNRVLPVRLNTLSISEELFDTTLNPIRATVSLNMRALSYSDLSPNTRGYNLFMVYQQGKEAMATLGISNAPNANIGVDVNRF